MTPEQQLAPPHKMQQRCRTRTGFGWSSSDDGSPISSRVSQNAAALLFELGTVDIR
jgi:hypothetical protein